MYDLFGLIMTKKFCMQDIFMLKGGKSDINLYFFVCFFCQKGKIDLQY